MAEETVGPHDRFALAIATTVLLIPVVAVAVPWAEPGGIDDFNRRVTLQPFDLGVLATGALAAPLAWRERTRLRWSWALAPVVGLGGWYVVAFLANPNWRGVELLVRLAVLAVIAIAARGLDRRQRNAVMAVTTLVAALQAILALAQSANGAVLGLRALEFRGFLYPFGDDVAGRGGLTHPYHLAVLLMIGLGAALVHDDVARRSLVTAAAGVIGLGLACTFSRAGALALGLALGVVLVGRRVPTTQRRIVVAALAGFVVGALVFSSGWLARAESTSVGIDEEATGSGGSAIDSGRRQFIADAGELVADHPVLGVGPGRYVTALDDALDIPRLRQLPPHNVVVHAAAEAGIPAAALVVLCFLALASYTWRRRPSMAVGLVLLLPYFLLDAFPYSFPAGLAALAIPAVGLAPGPEEPT